MGISLLRATGRLLAPVVAVGLLAGVSLEAGAASQGKVVLNLGSANDVSAGYFEAFDKDGDSKGTQTFKALKGCTFNADANNKDYVDLFPKGGRNDPNPGFGATSIGVFDGPPGVPCSRIESGKHESLTVALGAGLAGAIGYSPATANKKLGFEGLEFDIEAKGDVNLKLETLVKVDTSSDYMVLRTYWLKTGSGVDPLDVADEGFVADPSQTIFNCRAASDSGSDSFGNDNCQWRIADIGQAFRLTPVSGDVSLESGGDFNESTRTVIYLGEIDAGTLYCSNDATAKTISPIGGYCEVGLQSVAYLDSDVVNACSTNYVMTFDGQTCGFYTPPGVQIVANVKISYGSEPALEPVDPPGTNWRGAVLSQITFGDKGGPFPIPQCLGLTIDDSGNGFGPEPIQEVVENPQDYDLIPDNGDTTEFACAYARWESYATIDGQLKVTIEEDVQFWSDPVIARGQN